MISDDLLETSVAVANRWKEEFVVSENQNQRFGVHSISQKKGGPFCLSSDCLTGTLTHLGGEVDNPIKLTQNNPPGFGTGADEALVINLQSRKYHLD